MWITESFHITDNFINITKSENNTAYTCFFIEFPFCI